MPTQQKTSPRRGRRTRKPAISPERRCFILALWGIALVVLFSIPLGKIPAISLISTCLKGLFGLGYYFVPLSLLVGGYMLLAHPGTLGVLQVLIGCIIPIPIGSIHHAICYVADASESPAPSLWETGAALESGGVISGGLAQVFVAILGNTISAVLFAITLAALLGIEFLPSLFVQNSPNRRYSERHYSQEADEFFDSYYPETDSYTSGHTSPKRTRSTPKPNISEYNMPMDGDKVTKNADLLSEPEEITPRGFYIPKSDSTYAPADLMLKILGESLQTPPDIPPATAPVEQPKTKQPSAPVRPPRSVKRPATWTPFVWTPTTRSEPAWVIPANSDNKSKKRDPDKKLIHQPEDIQKEDQTPATESPQDANQPDIIEQAAEESSKDSPELAAEEPIVEETDDNQVITAFTLIGYFGPHKSQRISPKQPKIISNSQPKPSVPLSLPLSKPILLLSGRSIFRPIKRLPSPPPLYLLPAPRNVLLSDGTALEKTAFELVDYIPPTKRVYKSRSGQRTSYPIKNLPAPAPVLLLPPASLSHEISKQTPEIPGEAYTLPSLELFNYRPNSEQADDTANLDANTEHLCDVLKSFGVKVSCGDVVRGPAITQYEFTLERGVKLAKITNLADDIALSLGASAVRIAPIPGKISVVGIEVPNKQIAPVYIRDVLASPEFREHKSPVAFAIGKDIGNRSVIGDIAALPHILIAGTTGSGKSVCTNSIISSILCKASPDDARFIMIDPKMVELAPYNGIPHLLVPVVTDPKKAAGALQWAVFEMMKRYKQFSELGVKKLAEYNALAKSGPDIEHMPTIVIVIDELADLMLVAAKEVEESICRVAQMGRAAGMHLVIATQRPSSDVITGLMKANIPSRIAFAVASSLESRIILDGSGAEKLVGRGDMLYSPLGVAKPQRVQGCYITREEIERVVNYVKSTSEAHYSDEVMEKIEESVKEKDSKGDASNTEPANAPDSEEEILLRSAVEIFLECGQASVSMLQRRLKLGYSRAARLVDEMEERGYVGPFEGSKPRKILISKAEWAEICLNSDVESDNF